MASTSSSKAEAASAVYSRAKQKITALTRLKSFSTSFIYRDRETSPIVFPPPSWELSDDFLGTDSSSPSLLESNFEDVRPVDPTSFAQKLRNLIEAIPWSPKQTPAVSPASDDGRQGSPVPPGLSQHLVQLLSSEDLMNGERRTTSSEGGKSAGRIGIWNILAGLRKRGVRDDQNASPVVIEEAENGIMIYSPLQPESDSQVELASPETLLEYVDEKGVSKASREDFGPHVGSSTSPHQDQAQKDVVVERQVWVPSTTELSVFTTWWGYRLYLPPPIMEKLNGKSVKATARAAMITTALKWLLEKIPIALVPVQFRAAVKMLKQLSPVVGYIGVFIAWSWDRVRSLDEGNGVVLTATWLLPVALVPMTWDAGDIYGPPLPPNLSSERIHAVPQRDKVSGTKNTDDIPKPKKNKPLFRW